MKFPEALTHGRLIKRYKRFLADVTLDSGEVVTAHCTNSGSMKTCLEEGAEVFLTHHNDPKRKTQYTWEMIKIDGDWVGINTNHPNRIAFEAIRNNEIAELRGYSTVKREVKQGRSRIDIYAANGDEECFIEVKNVTMKEGRYALFPDAVTARGKKHLEELILARGQGYRTVMLYVVQRMDVDIFGPARAIDPGYAAKLDEALAKGVEIIAVQARVTPQEIKIVRALPCAL
ncbi:MAG: DNA/RNA nuclease SfsA [Bacteroidales bacterium]|nr:DNA/RNA nuclease SfsA [Bacteroidales bacterium]